jgi:hypothetical protein
VDDGWIRGSEMAYVLALSQAKIPRLARDDAFILLGFAHDVFAGALAMEFFEECAAIKAGALAQQIE